MAKKKDRLTKATERILESTPTDYIIDQYETPDFIEFVCKAGGDVLTYRVYNDGSITER